MAFNYFIRQVHLWLGLTTGVVIFVVAITGAIYCFAPELQKFQRYRSVAFQPDNFLSPSRAKFIAENKVPGRLAQRIYYGGREDALMVLFSTKDSYSYSVFINPYSGKVLHVRNNDRDFLSLVLKIHRTLLVPYGHDIIRWCTLIFCIILVSGIILWWPKNSKTAKHGFIVKWRANPKRLNYDLHKVLGFYASWVLIFTAVTGLIFTFESFADVVYKITGNDKSIVQKKAPLSKPVSVLNMDEPAIDRVWGMINRNLDQDYASALFVLPTRLDAPILLRTNPEKGTLYKTDFRYFDQYTGAEIPGAYVWGSYKDARTLADNIKRMNYDIHTGAILGLPGRIAVFFAALIAASLPITGSYFWWSKNRKLKRAGVLKGPGKRFRV